MAATPAASATAAAATTSVTPAPATASATPADERDGAGMRGADSVV